MPYPLLQRYADPTRKLPPSVAQWFTALIAAVNYLLTGTQSGQGDPNGAVTADPGMTYRNTLGGAGATFWVKESGVDTNTGWVAK
jgi:hypothetical protein